MSKQAITGIPTFECIKGCSDCCGAVPWTDAEFSRVAGRKELDNARLDVGFPGHVITSTASGKCPFSSSDGCAVYADRPLVCRMFGAVDDPMLTCPHGCRPPTQLGGKAAARLVKDSVKKAMRP